MKVGKGTRIGWIREQKKGGKGIKIIRSRKKGRKD